MEPIKKRMVTCPTCNKLEEFSPNNPYRPFCSERCQLVDLGVWATEGYTIPEAIKPEDFNE